MSSRQSNFQQTETIQATGYVVDRYLKRFTHEIYAVNRDQCREHLDRSLETEGKSGLDRFAEKAKDAGIAIQTSILYGEPEKIVADVASADGYDVVILGAKRLEGWWQRFESCNLPSRIFRSVDCPLLFVK